MVYRIQTSQYGELLKVAGSIREARAWARAAFPGEACPVSRLVLVKPRGCRRCGCSPCIGRRGLGVRCADV